MRIVRALVEQIGGELRIGSADRNQGARFTGLCSPDSFQKRAPRCVRLQLREEYWSVGKAERFEKENSQPSFDPKIFLAKVGEDGKRSPNSGKVNLSSHKATSPTRSFTFRKARSS